MLSAILSGGHEAWYLRLEDAGRALESRPLPEGTQVIQWRGGTGRFSWWMMPALVKDLKRVLRQVQPELVHAGPLQSVGLIAALTGFHPLLGMSWGFDLMQDADKNACARRITRRVLARLDWLFGDCQAVLDKAARLGYDTKRSTRFPWGVDLAHFSPGKSEAIRERLGWQDATILFCNRSWEAKYGVDLVARAFVQSARADGNLRLILAGSGSQRELIEEILRQGGVRERVFFAGQIPNRDLPDWYRAADVYISASHTDGSSVSLMEALACGLPAVISDIPANLEWVTDGEQGWLFKDGSQVELAACMGKTQTNKVDLAIMRIKALHQAEAKADWEKNRQTMLDGYRMAVSR
jgi:glycosyltransferase involved in cell wall biosynthesis